jgi:hypothetical protein
MSGRALLWRATHQVAKPSTTRRVVADFFSILVTTTAPISAVLATCVPPQGWKSISSVAPMRIVRMVPLPRGGCTLMLFTSAGLASSSASVMLAHRHRVRCGHQRGDGGGQRILVQRIGHVEVQARVVGRDRAAVDQLRHHMAQQVGGGVKPHQPVAPRPVDAGGHRVADLQSLLVTEVLNR